MEYRLRFAALEWSKIEYELTRERGLWGPHQPSPLDKWMVDIVEGKGVCVCVCGGGGDGVACLLKKKFHFFPNFFFG